MTITHLSPIRPVLDLLRATAASDAVRHTAATFDPAATERDIRHLGLSSDPDGEDSLDLWLISWPPGSHTGWHDHGNASGGFTVISGALTEHSWNDGVHTRELSTGQGRTFGSRHIHEVVNEGTEPAVSVHAYPRLMMMTRYLVHSEGIQIISVDRVGAPAA